MDALAAHCGRPSISDADSELLQDSGEPLPALLAVFEKHDAIEGQFDEEAQGMMEVMPEPNAIIAVDIDRPDTVNHAFSRLGVGCAVLTGATKQLATMPDGADAD